MQMHQGHKKLLIDMYKHYVVDKSKEPFVFPPNEDPTTARNLDRAGCIIRSRSPLDGMTTLMFAHGGQPVAKQLYEEQIEGERRDADRRLAKERALHSMGVAIQALTELDTPSNSMLDRSLERIMAAHTHLANVRKA